MTLLINNMTLVHDKLLANLHLETFIKTPFNQQKRKISTPLKKKNKHPTDNRLTRSARKFSAASDASWRMEGGREGEGRDPSIFLEAQDKHLWRPGSHLVISGGNISLVWRSRAGGLDWLTALTQVPPTCRQPHPGGQERRGEERHGTWFLQW